MFNPVSFRDAENLKKQVRQLTTYPNLGEHILTKHLNFSSNEGQEVLVKNIP